MFIIIDRVTTEILSQYDPQQPSRWQWDGTNLRGDNWIAEHLLVDVEVFNTRAEAELVVEHLSQVIGNNNQEIDFEVVPVKYIEAYQIAEGYSNGMG